MSKPCTPGECRCDDPWCAEKFRRTPAHDRKIRRLFLANRWRRIRQRRREQWIHGAVTESAKRGWGPPAPTKDKVRLRARRRLPGLILGCEICGAHGFGLQLEFHHLHYRCVDAELLRDLLLLCRECHHAQHFRPHFVWDVEGLPIVGPVSWT